MQGVSHYRLPKSKGKGSLHTHHGQTKQSAVRPVSVEPSRRSAAARRDRAKPGINDFSRHVKCIKGANDTQRPLRSRINTVDTTDVASTVSCMGLPPEHLAVHPKSDFEKKCPQSRVREATSRKEAVLQAQDLETKSCRRCPCQGPFAVSGSTRCVKTAVAFEC